MTCGTGGFVGTAFEVVENRKHSPIGATQHHYLLEPVLITPEGVCSAVVVIAGHRATYIYPCDPNGDIADYVEVAMVPGGTPGHDALAVMGYRIAASDQLLAPS